MILGTAAYMAPSRRAGSRRQARDIWAFGCVLYEMLDRQARVRRRGRDRHARRRRRARAGLGGAARRLPPPIVTFLRVVWKRIAQSASPTSPRRSSCWITPRSSSTRGRTCRRVSPRRRRRPLGARDTGRGAVVTALFAGASSGGPRDRPRLRVVRTRSPRPGRPR